MLKLYIYGYLNQLCSSRRLEREAGRNVELIWLTSKLAPDLETSPARQPATLINEGMPYCRRFVRRRTRIGKRARIST
jgi:hypothetical protein